MGALLAAVILAHSAWNTIADPVFVPFDVRELAQTDVTSVAQDSTGFVWVGTQGGVARFDGYRFLSYLPNPSDPKALPDGFILTLLGAGDGSLWLGTGSSGPVRFDQNSESFTKVRSRSLAVYTFAERNGAIWLGGDAGVERLDPRSQTFEPVEVVAGKRQPVARSLLFDPDGGLWAGTTRGLFYKPAASARFERRTPDAIASRVAYSLYRDAKGHIWVGSDDAIFAIDRAGRVVASFHATANDPSTIAPGRNLSIAEPTPGSLWIGAGGLSVLDLATGRAHRVPSRGEIAGGLPPGQVRQLMRDRSGLLWVANSEGGLLAFNPLARGLHQISGKSIGLGERGAYALASRSAHAFWASGYLGSLVSVDGRANAVRTFTVPGRTTLFSLLERDDGSLVAGTDDGWCTLPKGARVASCPKGALASGTRVLALLDTGTEMWMGTNAGLISYDRRGAVRTYRLSNDTVETLFRDRRGRIWAGTDNGLNRIDAFGRVVAFAFDARNENTIGPGETTSIAEDRQGRIWAGALGGPLDVVEELPGGATRVRRLSRADGMPDENVGGIARDDRGRMWASTAKGLALFDPIALRARSLGLADGVFQTVPWSGSVARAADGTIYFGGFDGVVAIDPGASSPWNFTPPVIVTSLRGGGKSLATAGVNRGAKVRLPPDGRDVTVEFAALDYSMPSALRYAYKLDGYDREWIATDSAHRIATYTNLGPGEYTLRVRATNRVGAWSDRPLAIGISAAAAWYETWWFRGLVLLALVAAAFGAGRGRTALLRARQRELEALVEARTRELHEMSLTDPLTGLRNRRFLFQTMDAEAALAVRQNVDLIFFVIDIDFFKAINDRYGHAAGDHILMQMRARLLQVFRDSDFLVRWGGEEFLAVARGTRREEAPEIAERVRRAIALRRFDPGRGGPLEVTASIGFAAFPFVRVDPAKVPWTGAIDIADRALYMAKEAGRNTWVGLRSNDRGDDTVPIVPETVA